MTGRVPQYQLFSLNSSYTIKEAFRVTRPHKDFAVNETEQGQELFVREKPLVLWI